MFPFVHNNVTYYGCPTDPEDEIRRWCSTKTDENDVHVDNEDAWGYCESSCNPHILSQTFDHPPIHWPRIKSSEQGSKQGPATRVDTEKYEKIG